MHGKTSPIHHKDLGVFAGLANPLTVTRYHSLVVKRESLPECLEVTAWTQHADGSLDEIMGVRHKTPECRGRAVPSRVHPSPSRATSCWPTSSASRAACAGRATEMDIKGALNRIVNQLDLTTEEMQAVMRQIMTGQCTDAQIGAFLMGMRMKSETIDEIVGAVAVMRELADGVQLPTLKHVVDVVGTGGDGANIFNVSSAASFVVAAAGGKVA